MKILLLSCNTGEGHNAAARAIKEALELHHHEAVLLDLMSLGKKNTSALVSGAYLKLVKFFPAGFGFLYQLGEIARRILHKSPVYYANAKLAHALASYLAEHPFDAVVTTHLYPAETMTCMKEKGLLSIPSVAVATDYVCIPFWEETACDYYVIPHKDLEAEFISYGVPKEKLLPFGIPVRPSFSKKMTKEKVREYLHLPPDGNIFLVMSGSMGFGKIQLLSRMLSAGFKNGEQMVIICGNNHKLERSLRHHFSGNPAVRIVGFTRHVAEYMAACDVLYTKPGGLSSTEAAIRQIPILHTDPIPGCETKNRAFFVSHGMSLDSGRGKEAVCSGMELMHNREMQQQIRQNQKENSLPDAAEKIVQLLESLT